MKYIKEYFSINKALKGTYHYTDIFYVENIFKENRIKVSKVYGNLSVTTNPNLWRDFGAVRFTLNRQFIKDYHPEDFDYETDYGEVLKHEEEGVIYKDIYPLTQYVETTHIRSDLINAKYFKNKLQSFIIEYGKKYNIEVMK